MENDGEVIVDFHDMLRNLAESTICKPNFYSVASLLAACYLLSQEDKHDDNNLFIRILLDIFSCNIVK
jgi:hypothetical protein